MTVIFLPGVSHKEVPPGRLPGSGSVSFSEWASYAEDMKVGPGGEFSMGVLNFIEIFHLERCTVY